MPSRGDHPVEIVVSSDLAGSGEELHIYIPDKGTKRKEAHVSTIENALADILLTICAATHAPSNTKSAVHPIPPSSPKDGAWPGST
jgi:hypothetical protein